MLKSLRLEKRYVVGLSSSFAPPCLAGANVVQPDPTKANMCDRNLSLSSAQGVFLAARRNGTRPAHPIGSRDAFSVPPGLSLLAQPFESLGIVWAIAGTTRHNRMGETSERRGGGGRVGRMQVAHTTVLTVSSCLQIPAAGLLACLPFFLDSGEKKAKEVCHGQQSRSLRASPIPTTDSAGLPCLPSLLRSSKRYP